MIMPDLKPPSDIVIQLKHMQLNPDHLIVTEPVRILLKINQTNSASLSQCSDSGRRKFIFMIEETDEESDPLAEGQSYQFNQPLVEVGTYHLLCLNYTKIKSVIEVTRREEDKLPEIEVLEPKVPVPPVEMQNIVEVQEQKQEETREGYEQNLNNSHSRSDYAEYEKILNDTDDMHYDATPNRYIKYFKEEFKLWRDFFQTDTDKPVKEKQKQKDKYASQREQNLSNNSLSFSEKQSQNEASVVSHLRSHQEISDINEEELSHPKTMKKTNSEYRFNVEREVQKTHVSSNSKKRPFYTTTSSPHQRTQQSEAQTFMDWANSWTFSQGLDQVVIKKRGDRHLVKQWNTYLSNKFKISEFMYG